MPSRRPDPDAILQRVREEERTRSRGRLRIFFGASPGVGKTYAMLEAARREKASGVDVVAGWVETHGRAETAALLEGIELLPSRSVDHRGVMLREFDLDGALVRRPALLLLDELAHTNAPGSRHLKRWQDAQELLEAGIDVWSTLNVQHLASMADLVAQVTEVPVREIVPDGVLDDADEVEFVDLPPDDLLERLREGKVYLPEVAQRAARNFFRKGNLIALRELALRRTAERVEEDVRDYHRAHEVERAWPVTERILVCIRPNPETARLVQAGRRLAGAAARGLGGGPRGDARAARALPFRAADAGLRLQAGRRPGRRDHGPSGGDGERGPARLRTRPRRQQDRGGEAGAPALARSPVRLARGRHGAGQRRDRRLRGGGGGGAGRRGAAPRAGPAPGLPCRAPVGGRRHGRVHGGVLGRRAWIDRSNLVMIYLLGVVFVATRFGRWPAVTAAVLSVAAFDFFFVPPHLTFAVSDTQYIVTFFVMLTVALLISGLAARAVEQAEAAHQRGRRTQLLYTASRELSGLSDPVAIARAGARRVAEVMRGAAVVLLPDGTGGLLDLVGEGEAPFTDTRERAVADWVFQHGRAAGRGTDTLSGASGLYCRSPAARDRWACWASSRTRRSCPWARPASSCWRRWRASSPPRWSGAGCALRRGGRAPAQHAPQLRVARPAHAAGGDHGRRVQPALRAVAAAGGARWTWRRPSTRRRRASTGASATCST